MDFLPREISDYAELHTSAESSLLSELNRDTNNNVLMPRMLSGHLQGRFLSLLSNLSKPQNILEIGTYTGYSALCLSEGLQPNGQLHTIEVDDELKDRIEKYFTKSNKAHQLHLHIGDANEIIPKLPLKWDLVFIDADKENYCNYFDLIIENLNPNGIIIADNVLWSGKVLNKAEINIDKETAGLDAYNKKISADTRVENILLPIRDGLMICRKK